MRSKTVICLVLLSLGLLAILWASVPADSPVSITFVGYAQGFPYRDGGHNARFVVKNHTGRPIMQSEACARIQIKTSGGWIDYDDPEDFLRVDGIYGTPHGQWLISRHFPRGHGPWRLHVSTHLLAPRWARFRPLEGIAAALKAGDTPVQAASEEMRDEAGH